MERRTHGFDDVVDKLLRLVDLLLRLRHDETVQVLLLVAGVRGVGSALALLDGALASDGDLGAGILFHLLQSVATRANEQTNFVSERKLSVSFGYQDE